jgi:hypothetical protein
MKDNGLWRMFCDTGDPVCYLIYKSTAKEKKSRPDFPPTDSLAFSGTGENPRVRF